MEEPGRLQSMGSRRVRHDWMTSLSLFTFMYWRRKWQPTPEFLPGESQGRRSMVGYSPWAGKESDITERLHFTSQGLKWWEAKEYESRDSPCPAWGWTWPSLAYQLHGGPLIPAPGGHVFVELPSSLNVGWTHDLFLTNGMQQRRWNPDDCSYMIT